MKRLRFKRVVALFIALSMAPTYAPAQTADSGPVAGDLTNLVFTATGPLTAGFVSPKDGQNVKASMPLEVSTVPGAGVEVVVNGDKIPFSQIGERMVGKTTGETHYVYYGIEFKPGANELSITPLGAGGTRGATTHATVYGPGPAVAVHATIRTDKRADGTATAHIHVMLLDQLGHPAAPRAIRATVVSGDVTLGNRSPEATAPPATGRSLTILEPNVAATASPSPVAARIPLAVPLTSNHYEARSDDDGTLDIPLTPGLLAGDAFIRIDAGAGVTSTAKYFVQPNLRSAIVMGLVTGGVGSIPSVPGEDPGVPDGLNSKRARVALFASGKVLEKALLTFAYDTANTLDQTTAYGSFNANPDERPYLTYGDASTRRDDALSRNHLYARLEEGNTSLMWGEFQARTGSGSQSSIGGLDLLVNGAKLELGNGATHGTVFTARNDVAYGRQTFTPTGLATLFARLHSDIVVGSDIVDLVTLDRRTGIVIAEVSLTPNVDYTLDYISGEIRFINIPLPFDQNFNPQQILVRYQYRGTGNDAETTGWRVSTAFGNGGAFRAGAGYANNSQGLGNVALFSQYVSGIVPGGTWSVEHMGTRGQVGSSDPLSVAQSIGSQTFGGSGDAWRAALATAFKGNKFGLDFEKTSAGYDNPFGGLATPGLLSYRAMLSRAINGGSIDSSFDYERNAGVGFQNSVSNVQVRVKKKFGRKLTVGAGLALHRYASGSSFVGVPTAGQDVNAVPTPVPVPTATSSSGTPAIGFSNPNGSVTQASLSAAYKLSPAVDFSVSRLWDIAGSVDAISSAPSEMAAELGVGFGKRGRAYVRQMWDGAPNQAFAASSVPLTTQTQGTRSTAIGFERSLGAATSVDSEYVLQNGANGADVYAALGVREQFAIRKDFKGAFHVQRANASGSGLSGFNLYGISLAYSKNAKFKGTGSYESRTGDNSGSTLSLGAAGAIAGNVYVIASLADAHALGFSSNRDRVSVALRPAHNDNSITLLGYDRETGNDAELDNHTETLSLEQFLRPARKTQLSGRLAYKLDGDRYYAAHTYLLGLRGVYKLGGPNGRQDIAFETRYLGVGGGITGGNAFGYAVGSGLTIGDAMRLAIGYNFAAAPDPNLSVAQKRKGFYVTFTSAIDSIFGWGKR